MNYVGLAPAPDGMILVGDTNPVGLIGWFHGAPDGSWLRLNGQVVSKAAYPELWAYAQGFLTADQTANPGLYRSVDGSTFAVPKLDGLFVRGVGQYDANHAAAALGVKQDDLLRTHQHTASIGSGGGASNGFQTTQANGGNGAGNNASQGYFLTDAPTVTSGNETRSINVALVPCVKALRSLLIPAALMPAAQVSFTLNRGAALTIPNATWTDIAWDTIEYSTNPSAHNLSTGAFTVPIAGVYAFYAQFSTNSGNPGSSLQGRFLVNGAQRTVNYVRFPGSGAVGLHVSYQANLAAGDTVAVGIFQDTTASQGFANAPYNVFHGFRLP